MEFQKRPFLLVYIYYLKNRTQLSILNGRTVHKNTENNRKLPETTKNITAINQKTAKKLPKTLQ